MAERCARWPACSDHHELADVLGHDLNGHIILNALVHRRVTTVTELAEMAELPDVELLDVRLLGPVRIAHIRRQLAAADRKDGQP